VRAADRREALAARPCYRKSRPVRSAAVAWSPSGRPPAGSPIAGRALRMMRRRREFSLEQRSAVDHKRNTSSLASPSTEPFKGRGIARRLGRLPTECHVGEYCMHSMCRRLPLLQGLANGQKTTLSRLRLGPQQIQTKADVDPACQSLEPNHRMRIASDNPCRLRRSHGNT
jgi:hypothetical protein